MMHLHRTHLAALLVLSGLALALTSWAAPRAVSAQDGAEGTLGALLGAEDIELDREAGAVSIPATMLVTHELLEYLLVGMAGSAHESLLATEATPSLVNAAILAAGVEPGKNAFWQAVEPFPTDEEIANGAEHHRLVLPTGDGVLPYLAWREGKEVYFVRVEDAICDLESGRSMRRHRWVYLGSRFATLRKGGPEVFVADEEENLINLTFFTEGNTLVTAALPECETQTIWRANDWILPPRGQKVRLILAHHALDRVPESFMASLPEPSRVVE